MTMFEDTPAPEWEPLETLSSDEEDAAIKYGMASGLFHLAYQADHNMVLQDFGDYMENQRRLPLVAAATQKFRLTSPAILYSGHGNSAAVIGGLYGNDAEDFIGMQWQYRGVISTSSSRWRAVGFMGARSGGVINGPAMLTFKIPAGSKLLPMPHLGTRSSGEDEYVLPPASSFEIIDACYRDIDEGMHVIKKVLHLTLQP